MSHGAYLPLGFDRRILRIGGPQHLLADAGPGGIRFGNLRVGLEHKPGGHESIDCLNKRSYVSAIVSIQLVNRGLVPEVVDSSAGRLPVKQVETAERRAKRYSCR